MSLSGVFHRCLLPSYMRPVGADSLTERDVSTKLANGFHVILFFVVSRNARNYLFHVFTVACSLRCGGVY